MVIRKSSFSEGGLQWPKQDIQHISSCNIFGFIKDNVCLHSKISICKVYFYKSTASDASLSTFSLPLICKCTNATISHHRRCSWLPTRCWCRSLPGRDSMSAIHSTQREASCSPSSLHPAKSRCRPETEPAGYKKGRASGCGSAWADGTGLTFGSTRTGEGWSKKLSYKNHLIIYLIL